MFSLRMMIGLTITLILAGIAFVRGGSVGAEAEKMLRREIGQSLAAIAAGMSDKLDSDMRSRVHQVSVLASLDVLVDDVGKAQRLVNDVKARDRDVAWIGVTDVDGKVKASSNGVLLGVDIGRRPVFTEGRKGLFVGDVHEAVLLSSLLPNPTGETMKFVDVAAPLKDRDGKTHGVLAVHYSWAWARGVVDEMLSFAIDREGLEVFVVTRDGMVLLGPQSMIGKPLAVDALKRAQGGESGWQVTDWPDGGEYLTGYSSGVAGGTVLADLDWSVLVRRPIGLAFSPAQDMRRNILISGLAVALAFGALGWVAAGYIARPISTIAAAADRMRNGEQGAAIPDVGGAREIRVLSHALRELVLSLTKSHSDLAESNQALARMEDIAYQDRLTALPNRRFFEQYLEIALTRARDAGMNLVVMYIDLDGFKPVNDRLGHDAGDEVLRQIGVRFASSLRQDDVVARIGGDEFAAVLVTPDGTSGEMIEAPRRFITTANEPIYCNGETARIGCSVGVAVWPQDGGDLTAVLKRADEALYEAKRRGKNQAVVYADIQASTGPVAVG